MAELVSGVDGADRADGGDTRFGCGDLVSRFVCAGKAATAAIIIIHSATVEIQTKKQIMPMIWLLLVHSFDISSH